MVLTLQAKQPCCAIALDVLELRCACGELTTRPRGTLALYMLRSYSQRLATERERVYVRLEVLAGHDVIDVGPP